MSWPYVEISDSSAGCEPEIELLKGSACHIGLSDCVRLHGLREAHVVKAGKSQSRPYSARIRAAVENGGELV
jgi:hypothetical protein